MKFSTTLSFIFLPYLIFAQVLECKLLLTEEINIRDPYIFADSETQNYYMYAQMDKCLDGDDKKLKGVEVFIRYSWKAKINV